MKRTAKKIVSLLLAAVIVFGAVPLAGFVGLELTGLKELFAIETEAAIATNGSLGNNIDWSLNTETGLLTISGSGKMYGYSKGSESALAGIRYKIKSVEISSGIENIGAYVFYDCDELLSIIIPKGIISIGNSAFRSCSSLENIIIPNEVESIGERAFQYCYNLKEILIPNSVKTIGNSAFSSCTSLEQVKLSENLTTIEQYTFNDCSSLKNIVVPNNVTAIHKNAFANCVKLEQVFLSEKLLTIETYAFLGCETLKNIIFPNSLETIAIYAFSGCSGITQIFIPQNVSYIGSSAFVKCSNLAKITVDKNNIFYINDDFGVLYDIDQTNLLQYPIGSSLENYTISKSAEKIEVDAFSYCSSLKTITIPDSVKVIGDRAFSYCASLKNIYWGKGLNRLNGSTFEGCSSLKSISVPEGVSSLQGTFKNCSSLVSVSIPDSVTSIAKTFYHCSNLQSVVVGKGLSRVYGETFWGCDNLEDIYYEGFEEEWDLIEVDSYLNEPFFEAKVHFNSNVDEPVLPLEIPVKSIKIAQKKIQIAPEDKTYIETEIFPENAHNKDIVWKSSNTNVATINEQTGLLCAVNPGFATITATTVDGGYMDNCVVFVGQSTLSVSSTNEYTIEEGETESFYISLISPQGIEILEDNTVMINSISDATNKDLSEITFVIANSSIAAIESISSKNGVITAVVKGISTGSTYVTITNNITGEIKYFPVYVNNSENTYNITNVPEQNEGKRGIFNFCQHNVSVYDFENKTDNDGTTIVSFNAYNGNTNDAVVDVYDSNGILQESFMLPAFDNGNMTGVVDNFERMGDMIETWVNKDIFDPTSDVWSTHTFVKTTIPEKGYIKITNDISDSLSCCLYNVIDIAVRSINKAHSLSLNDDSIEKITQKVYKPVLEKSLVSSSLIKDIVKNLISETRSKTTITNTVSLLGYLQDLFAAFEMNYEEIFATAIYDVAKKRIEGEFLDSLGAYGYAVKSIYSINGIIRIGEMIRTCGKSVGEGSAYIYAEQSENLRISNGIKYDGAIDSQTVFRTFAVTYGNAYDNLIYERNSETAKLYDISMVKDGELVQPSTNVKVYIPIPYGWSTNDLKVYRVFKEKTGKYSYQNMNAVVLGEYLVFETDHFSYYAIVNDSKINITVKSPSITTISYGDSIILHAELSEGLPAGWKIVWEPDNENFLYSVSNDGTTCTISPSKSGNTIFTATVYDLNENVISSDEQVMTSKAGFFDKIIAFFKKLFGLTKTIPQIYQGIF